MNAETKIERQDQDAPPHFKLLARAYGDLDVFVERLGRLDKALADLEDAGGDTVAGSTLKLRRQIREFEPSVTMIGQVKAGKTTLVNAMIGRPDLLPADINPWTSVVTSIHMAPVGQSGTEKAAFRFFSEDEWTNLVKRGGRVGELANRAGAHKELEKVRQQLDEMREKSRKRLGRKFEMLLGQEHEYGYVDAELIQRYVCLGDDFGDVASTDKSQGRFADITRSADLFLGRSPLPTRLCIRDTPGVNDTFMIREQITLNAIRQSRLCVVVLSAHQALSTVDMALIRMISNIRSREVIIFVNRIDELGNPASDIPEIENSIRETLKVCGGPIDAEIIFGSALWACHAIHDDFESLPIASAEAMLNWAEHQPSDDINAPTLNELVWNLSGLPSLGSAIAQRVLSGEAKEFEGRAVSAALNAASGLVAAQNVVSRRVAGRVVRKVNREQAGAEIEAIATRGQQELDRCFEDLLASLESQLDGSRRTFLSRATASLIKHLELYGEEHVWTYDPAGLRVLARSRYKSFSAKAVRASEEIFQRVAEETWSLYVTAFDLSEEAIQVEPPIVPKAPAPVMLGQSIALDIKGNWWGRWWRRRRSYQGFAEEFSEMIDSEIAPVLSALKTDHAAAYRDAVKATLLEFIESQKGSLLDLSRQTKVDLEQLRRRYAQDAAGQKLKLRNAVNALNALRQPNDRSAEQ